MAPHISVTQHAHRLDGYMDAVGRVTSTDSLLYGLALRELASRDDASDILGVDIESLDTVQSIPREFQPIVEDFLGLNGRDRLSYYLIDYYEWFERYHGATAIHRVTCPLLRPEVENQAIHVIENPGIWCYLSIITCSKKPPDPPYKTPSPLDPRK